MDREGDRPRRHEIDRPATGTDRLGPGRQHLVSGNLRGRDRGGPPHYTDWLLTEDHEPRIHRMMSAERRRTSALESTPASPSPKAERHLGRPEVLLVGRRGGLSPGGPGGRPRRVFSVKASA